MNRKAQLQLIDSCFHRLTGCCEHSHDWDKYLALHEAEEKGHRRFCPAGVKCGITKAQAVRLFAVKEVFERFVSANEPEKIFTPQATDFFVIRHSVFAACAIVHSNRERILNEFRLREMLQFVREVDYVELNRDRRAQ